MFYDRNPESMRTVAGVCPAGCDPAPGNPAKRRTCPKKTVFFRKSAPRPKNCSRPRFLETRRALFGPPAGNRFFGFFNLPQHSLMLGVMDPGSWLRIPGLPTFTGAQDSGIPDAGSGGWGPGDRGLGRGSEIFSFYISKLPVDRPCGRYVKYMRIGGSLYTP